MRVHQTLEAVTRPARPGEHAPSLQGWGDRHGHEEGSGRREAPTKHV
jgi:hypothetical protein